MKTMFMRFLLITPLMHSSSKSHFVNFKPLLHKMAITLVSSLFVLIMLWIISLDSLEHNLWTTLQKLKVSCTCTEPLFYMERTRKEFWIKVSVKLEIRTVPCPAFTEKKLHQKGTDFSVDFSKTRVTNDGLSCWHYGLF